MATITDVALAAGVSRTSVSFAFNDPGQLSTATLQRIMEAAEQLGYYPNAAARTLTTKRTGTLGLLFPQRSATVFANPFFREFLCGIGEECDNHGFSLLLVSPIEGSLRRAVNAATVDGYLVLGLDAAHKGTRLLLQRRIPFVVVDGEPVPGVSSVNVDDEGGATAAAGYLLSQGHRDLLVLGITAPDAERGLARRDGEAAADAGPFSTVAWRRAEGYRRAFRAHGLVLAEEDVLACESTFEGGAAGFRAAWDAGRRPTALLAMSDVMALGAMKAAQLQGLRVPDDLEVIGFDDIAAASWTAPPLSTIHQPTMQKGNQAARLLLGALGEGASKIPHQIILPTHLVLRGSTRARHPGIQPPVLPRQEAASCSSGLPDTPLVAPRREEVTGHAAAP